jgi:membrane-bound ClpP family serine protease
MSTTGFVWGIVLIFVGAVVAMLVAPVMVGVVGAVGVAGVWFVVGLVTLRRKVSSEEEVVDEPVDRMLLS